MYVRRANFTDWEANHPGEPAPGASLDAEFDAILSALQDIQARLASIQRDDGAIANDSVGLDQLDLGLSDTLQDLVVRVRHLERRS
jgi:hypothetical protein